MAGIYIHIPFCKTRCIYCDFFTRTDMSSKKDYISALCDEILLRKNELSGEEIKTIYFGGGTPSQLTHVDLKKVLNAIFANFNVSDTAEITMEANPDDLSQLYLETLENLPFNRLSIGIQSFDDHELHFLKRRHSANKAKEAVKRCKAFGYKNISIDLIYGLPNQTLDIWKRNLEEAIALDIQHISSYHLIYEEGTKLYKLFNKGEVKPVDEDLSVEMFSIMIDMLKNAGFEHYEISNFAQSGFYSKHNSSYWLGDKYLGLGSAAHSFDGVNRMWNVSSIPLYIRGIEEKQPAIEIEHLDSHTRYNDFILTGMRTMWGVNIDELEKKFGADMKNYCMANIKKHVDQGLVSINNSTMKLTHNGIFVSDGIMSDLMWVK